MTSPRIVLKCDPKDLLDIRALRLFSTWDKELHDALAAACYRQAIEEACQNPAYRHNLNSSTPADWFIWIEQRAADLLAEKLR